MSKKPTRVDPEGERRVLALWRQGKRNEAFSLLMKLYGNHLLTYAKHSLRDRHLAEDALQKALFDAARALDSFEGRSSLLTWLCSILHHRCQDQQRSNGRRNSREISVESEELYDAGQPQESAMHGGPGSRHRELERCLGKLSPAVREQVLLRCYLGLSYAEIAEASGEASGTVQVRISRVLPKLRRCLQAQEVEL